MPNHINVPGTFTNNGVHGGNTITYRHLDIFGHGSNMVAALDDWMVRAVAMENKMLTELARLHQSITDLEYQLNQ